MRIALTRTGGFAGLTRRAEVETSNRADAEDWHRLAEEVRAEPAGGVPGGGVPGDGLSGGGLPGGGVPDGFRYALTVGGHTVHCADPELSPAQRALIRRLLSEGS